MFVSLLHKTSEFWISKTANFIHDRCIRIQAQNSTHHVLCPKHTQSPLRYWYNHTGVANDRNVTPKRHCNIRWKQSVGQILLKNIKPSEEFTRLYFLRSSQMFRRYGNFNVWPWKFMAKVRGKVSGQGHIWKNQPIYSHCFCFVQIGPCILKI